LRVDVLHDDGPARPARDPRAAGHGRPAGTNDRATWRPWRGAGLPGRGLLLALRRHRLGRSVRLAVPSALDRDAKPTPHSRRAGGLRGRPGPAVVRGQLDTGPGAADDGLHHFRGRDLALVGRRRAPADDLVDASPARVSVPRGPPPLRPPPLELPRASRPGA